MTRPVTVITGASAGLGEEFARQYSAKGHRLLLVARREEKLRALADELGNARILSLDLSKSDAADQLAQNLAAHGEHVDILINNAGFGDFKPFLKQDIDVAADMIALNCSALTRLAHMAACGMKERGSGGILNVASTAAFQPGPNMAVYFATKAYVLSFSEALHEELRGAGVHVSALCPGPTSTEFGEVAGFASSGDTFEKMSMQPEPVVATGIAALEANKAVVVAGAANKVGAQAHRILPRSWIRRAIGKAKF